VHESDDWVVGGVGDGGCGGEGDGEGEGDEDGDEDWDWVGSGSSSEVGGLSQFPMVMNSTRIQGKENSGIRNPGNCRRKRIFGIVGRFQSASPPITGKTVDELSSLVVVIQVKTVDSKPDSGWAPRFGGKVVMVEVSGGGVYVEPGVIESGGGKDGASGVGIEVIGLRQKSVAIVASTMDSTPIKAAGRNVS
jgi:hypothetical protein